MKFSKKWESEVQSHYKQIVASTGQRPLNKYGKPMNMKEFVQRAKNDIELTHDRNLANIKKANKQLKDAIAAGDTAKADYIKDYIDQVKQNDEAVKKLKSGGYTPQKAGTAKRLKSQSQKITSSYAYGSKIKKTKTPTQTYDKTEITRRMGISDNKTVTVNGNTYTFDDLARICEANGINLADMFLGDQLDYKYNRARYLIGKDNFSKSLSKIDDSVLDQEIKDAIEKMILQ